MKSHLLKLLLLSRPVWGAWIEILGTITQTLVAQSRAPYGARGLKFAHSVTVELYEPSRPVWGAWIEINLSITA